MLSPGDKLRDYEVIAPLTEGGMATLMLARRRGVGGFSRLVALKLVHQHLTEDSAMIRLFLDEARISAHVTHPNVVHVEEVGVHEGLYFIAMEYVHGVSLAHLLKKLSLDRRRMSPTLAVGLAAQVAEALHAAHEAVGERGTPLHVVHRDMSPQNVLLAHTGHVKLIDFGIAKSQAALHESRTGAGVLGKLRYMSPEQLNSEHVDLRTDVYALGVVLWEMLTARNFLRCHRLDDPRDTATRANPPPPSRYASLVKPALDRVLLRALAPDPAQRFPSALEFRRALLKAQPDAARIDALKLAGMLRAVVGEELDAQASKLPHEVTEVLEDTLSQRPRATVESLSELTMQLALTDMEPSGEHAPLDGEGRPNHRNLPTYPAESVSPQSETLRPGPSRTGALLSMISVGSLCLAVGLWVGRATAPQAVEPAQIVEAPPRTVSIAAASPSEPEPIAEGSPLTAHPRPQPIELAEPIAVIASPTPPAASEPEAAAEPMATAGVDKPEAPKRAMALRKRAPIKRKIAKGKQR